MSITILNKPYTKDSKGFYIMPNELHYLLHEMGLTAQEKLIYECLIRYSNNSENNPFPSYSTIQKFASCGRGTISKGLKKLEELGLVDILQHGTRQGQSNVYRIKYVYDLEKQQEKLRSSNGPNKRSEDVVIPYRRGRHDDIITSKEIEETIAYYESEEYKAEESLRQDALERLMAL